MGGGRVWGEQGEWCECLVGLGGFGSGGAVAWNCAARIGFGVHLMYKLNIYAGDMRAGCARGLVEVGGNVVVDVFGVCLVFALGK